jgi:hypothetical protein
MLGNSVESGWRATHFGLLKAKLILSTFWHAKWVSTSMNRYRMFFVQTSRLLPPSTHWKLTKHGRSFMQNNKLQTRSHTELKDNSIIPRKAFTSKPTHRLHTYWGAGKSIRRMPYRHCRSITRIWLQPAWNLTIQYVQVWLGTTLPVFNFHVIWREGPTNHMMTCGTFGTI